MAASPPPSFDVIATLRLALVAYWRDFAPITFLGFGLVTLPSLLARTVLGGEAIAADPTLGTIVQTGLGILTMLFFCAVSFGVMSALAGRPLGVKRFMRIGLAAAQPGLVVALILGAGVMSVAIVLLLGRGLGAGGAFLSLAAIVALLWALSVLLPAVPAAIAERRGPLEALRRAAQLTRGNRGRLLGLCLIVGLALVPALGFVNVVVFGPQASAEQVRELTARMSLSSPGLWIDKLTDLLLLGVLASIPAATYMQLIRGRA